MKVKGKVLILKIVPLLATVLTFLGLEFKFAYEKVVIKGLPEGLPDAAKNLLPSSRSLTRADWTGNFKQLSDLGVKSVGWWQAARVFLIISLVLVAIVALITIVQFFYNGKVLSLVKTCTSALGILSVLAFLITLLVGGGLIASKISEIYTAQIGLVLSGLGLTGVSATASYLPHLGVYFLTIFALVALVSALLDRHKD